MTAAAKPAPNFAAFAWGFLAVCVVVYVCKIAQDIIIPFVVAVFIWYLINAIARFLGLLQLKSGRRLPSFWRFALAILTLFGMAFVIFELVNQNVDEVIHEAPKFQESFTRIAQQATDLLHVGKDITLHDTVDQVVREYVDIGAVIRAFAGMLTDMAGKTLVVLFFVGFLLYEQRFFDSKLRWMLRDRKIEGKIRDTLHTIDIKVQKYIGVKAFVSFLDSSLTFAILSAFGVDFAGFWGVMAFFLHFIPYAGSFVAISMPVLITLIQFGDLGMFLMVLGSLCLSHAFLGHILDPYLMGNNLNLSPIFIITNLAIWGMIWGVPGMFLAIPILAITAIALGQFEQTRPLAVLLSKTGVVGEKIKNNMKNNTPFS